VRERERERRDKIEGEWREGAREEGGRDGGGGREGGREGGKRFQPKQSFSPYTSIAF